jgi:PKHD-type hydroxylase|tara:strand:- start:6005 stop:6634 length:630 start_codon:yes stop_codon:yes gene_type:complete
MNLKNKYWYFQEILSPRFCDELIEYGNSQKEQRGITGKFKDKKNLVGAELKDLKKKRDSNIAWLDDHWIYKEVLPYVKIANESSGWNFQWDLSESCQFTKYKLNQYYGWHCDSWDIPYDKPDDINLHNKIRKLTVVCSLSDPKDYIGGELEFAKNNNEPGRTIQTGQCREIIPRGSIVVFPSFMWHRVNKVTQGARYTLVMWICGKPYH